MKTTVSKITDSAKRRDTIGRNRVQAVSYPNSMGLELFNIQNTISSDNVEKITNIIVKDRDTGALWLLKYRIMAVEGDYDALQSITDYLNKKESVIVDQVSEGGNDND